MRALRTVLYLSILMLLAAALGAQVKSQVIQGEELENFLQKADFAAVKTLDIGITAPKKVTLVLDGQTRHGVFKTIDEYKDLMKFDDGRREMNFQDSWKS